jgi:hypothetical protein
MRRRYGLGRLKRRITARIRGSAITLARELTQRWQYAVLVSAAVVLLVLRRGVVLTLLVAAAAGLILVTANLPLPRECSHVGADTAPVTLWPSGEVASRLTAESQPVVTR